MHAYITVTVNHYLLSGCKCHGLLPRDDLRRG